MSANPNVIAMDGPAASGKSSVAREVAKRLGWIYVNTGNMYRAATWAIVDAGADVANEAQILDVISSVELAVTVEDGRSVVRVNGRDVEDELNSEAVNRAVSHVAKVAEVRARLVAMQQQLGHEHSVVMEGRDIGTVVFPDAPYKFYIDASEEVRMKRRGLQGQTDAVKERDKMDSTRKIAPLMAAPDAVVIDSSDLTLGQVIDLVTDVLHEHGFDARSAS